MRLTAGVVLGAVILAQSACAGVGIGGAGPAPAARGIPGFDTWRYPGDALMRAWLTDSPYRWVGYYLPAPCHRDRTWAGKRAELVQMGWAIAPIYVGQQAFEGPISEPGADAPVLCSRGLLTAEQGERDARDAIAQMRAEGFPAGSTVYLDLEKMDRVPPEMIEYYRAWIREVLRDGIYRPGTYAHRYNAAELYSIAQRLYDDAGLTESAPFWVAGGSGFTLMRSPAESGVPFADIWQGALDVHVEWGGYSLQVDENVAAEI